MRMLNVVPPHSRRLSAISLVLLLLGCGGGSAPEPYPRDIPYENLNGQASGYVFGGPESSSLGLNAVPDTYYLCGFGHSWCLSNRSVLTTAAEFQAFVAAQPSDEDWKLKILAAGSAVDFSRKQIWALKYGAYGYPAFVALAIRELENSVEIQSVVCSSIFFGPGWPFFSYVFAVVSRDVPLKPATYLDAKTDISGIVNEPPCPKWPG